MQHSITALPRVHALDGLRGLAVGGVLAYHAGFGWARGGFLGVSLFFTLSGFLICSLLLAEHAATGRIALGAFWARRARRLLPAAMVALGAIVLFGATVATGSQLRALRGDVVGALAYVANWRFVAAGTSYGDLWSSPSPVQHFWSLAIEEQLYVVLPLAVAGVLALTGGKRRPLAAVLTGGLGLSIVATFLVDDTLRAYYGTDVRAAELLVGALLAVAVSARPTLTARATRMVPAAGCVALALVVAAWTTTSQTDARLYRGGLLVHAVLVAAVIVAARVDGPVAAALSARPLRWLGRVSYGAYLYHWPIFLWLSEQRTGFSGMPLATLRIGVSLGAAALSVALLEEPIRARRRFDARTGGIALGVTAVAVSACLVVVTTSPPVAPVSIDVAAAPALIAPSTVLARAIEPAPSPTVTGAPAAAPPRADARWQPGEPLRVYVAGDSNAYLLGAQLARWGESRRMQVWTSGWFACHIVPGGTYRWANQPKRTEDKCNDWPITRAAEVAAIRPHAVLVLYGSFDLLDRRFDGEDAWVHVGQPAFDGRLAENIARMTDVLGATGARVVWTTYPRTRSGVVDGVKPTADWPETASYRTDRLNTLIRQAVARRPFAEILDLRRHLQATWPGGELDEVRRPDGIHPNPHEAKRIAAWMGDQLLATMARP